MTEPWGDQSGDVLLELSFTILDVHRARARASVDEAFAELDKGYPADAKVDERLKARAARVKAANPNVTDLIELALSEFLSRHARATTGARLAEIRLQAEKVKKATHDLQQDLAAIQIELGLAEVSELGHDILGSLSMAAGHAADCLQQNMMVLENLKYVADRMPKDGRGETWAPLSVSPEIALFKKLEKIWLACGLSIRGGRSGDAIDVFLEHAIKIIDKSYVCDERGFSKLKEKAKKEAARLSGETTPQK